MSTGFLFAILTGILYGAQGAYGKLIANKFPSSFLTWATFTFTLPFVFILLAVSGIPQIDWFNFVWSTAISFTVNLIAWNLFFRALAASPLFLTMPFTALTPLFLIPVAFFMLDELPGLKGIMGILLIIGGAYGIHLKSGNIFAPFKSLFCEKGTRYMLLVALIWSLSSTVDKVAILSSSPKFYAVIIHSLLAGAYLPYIYFYQRESLRRLPANLTRLLTLGTISGLVVIFQFSALIYLDVSYVIAFKRAGVIISVLLGYFMFRESHIIKNIIATALIVLGAVLILI